MSIVYFLAVGLTGLVFGFVFGQFWKAKEQNENTFKKQVETTKQELDSYKEEMTRHLDTTADIMSNIRQNYDNMMSQIEATNALLSKQFSSEKSMPFFSPETEKQLFKASITNPEQRSEESQLSEQPKDYSVQSSGVFTEQSSH